MGKASIKRDLFICESCGTRPCIATRYALSVIECNYVCKEWKPLSTIKLDSTPLYRVSVDCN